MAVVGLSVVMLLHSLYRNDDATASAYGSASRSLCNRGKRNFNGSDLIVNRHIIVVLCGHASLVSMAP